MTGLPPRPDPYTGQPLPPAAPFEFRSHGRARTSRSQTPRPPDGHGPVLEHYCRRWAWFIWLAAPVPIVFLLTAGIWYSGFAILSRWFTWIFLVSYLLFVGYTGRSDVVSAGADWVRFNRRWVRTYELTRVRYLPVGQGFSCELVLADNERSVTIPVKFLQANKQLWNYVYLGIRHSAANGAELTHTARSHFPELTSEQAH